MMERGVCAYSLPLAKHVRQLRKPVCHGCAVRSSAAHLKASPMACAPVAQAVATAWLGPCSPCAMLTAPAAMLTSVLGTKKGLRRRTLPSACAAGTAARF